MLPSPPPFHPPARNASADILKGVAVLLMIQVHIMEQFATPQVYEGLAGKISLFLGGPFCAPVFMAVMGYYLFSSHRKPVFYIRRGAGLSIILLVPLKILLKRSPFGYLFLAAIIAAVSPVFPTIPENRGLWPYILSFVGGHYDWSYFPLFPWLSYVLLGYSFRLFREQKRSEMVLQWIDRNLVWFLPFPLILIVTTPWVSGITHDLTGAYYHHGMPFFSWMLIFMAVYVYIVDQTAALLKKTRIGQLLCRAGIHVTFLYVIQWLIIGNIAFEIYKTANVWEFAIWTLIIATCSGILTLGWIRLQKHLTT